MQKNKMVWNTNTQETIGAWAYLHENYITIAHTATVKEAMSALVKQAADKEKDNIATLYVVDEGRHFVGEIDLKDLIIAREGTPLAQITKSDHPRLHTDMPLSDAIQKMQESGEDAFPVLDAEDRLVGVVTAADLAELVDDTLSDDYAKLGGLTEEEDLAESVWQSIRKRLPWLVILLVLGLGVSAVVEKFTAIVASLPVLMCFQSLILDMAGNVGTQSLAVAIRVLMDSGLERKQKAVLVWKEARVGFGNGVFLGLISSTLVSGYLIITGTGVTLSLAIAGCLGLAMLLSMLVSALFGTLIPIVFQQIGIDPAVASGPLITTVNDLVAVVTYYGLAGILLVK